MHERGEKCDPYLLSRSWTEEKPEWAREVNAGSQTKALLTLGGAFISFFQGRKKHPTFHKKGSRDSFYVSNDKARIKKEVRIHLPNIGDVRMAEKLRLKGKILRYVVSRKADKWYVGITVEMPDPVISEEVSSPVGVDVGVKHWAVASDGSVLDKPASIAKRERRLKRYQRMMARRQKESKNRNKARIKVAREYKRISDIKLDAVHKFTSQLVKNHDLVCCEDLNIVGMEKGLSYVRKAIHTGCLTELRRQLAYKAKHYVEVDRFFPSSKRCSNCGHINDKLSLSTRTYRCSACGTALDRDFNASVNLMKEGLRVYTEGHSGSACGEC
jgi:putative transposase